MRLKDPFSSKAVEMTKRTNKPRKPRDEESSDEVSGLTCQHVNKAVDLGSVKKSVLSCMWLVCSDCLKERTMIDGEPVASHDILVCLKCGFQGCNQSEIQHAVKHHQAFHLDSHCITISLNTWKAWCFECNEELSTHCNKKALAQTLDFLQKQSAKATTGSPNRLPLCRVVGITPHGLTGCLRVAHCPVPSGQPPSQAGPSSLSWPQSCRTDTLGVPHPRPHLAHRMTAHIRGIKRLRGFPPGFPEEQEQLRGVRPLPWRSLSSHCYLFQSLVCSVELLCVSPPLGLCAALVGARVLNKSEQLDPSSWSAPTL